VVHHYPNGIIASSSARQSDYGVHLDFIPFPLRNSQRLQQSSWLLMLCLDTSSTITHSHVLCDFPLHSVPPELLLQILIHLLTSRVYRVSYLMSLLEDQFLNRLDIGNTQMVLEPYHTFCILPKIFASFLLESAAEYH
jgi:hypothetical protein